MNMPKLYRFARTSRAARRAAAAPGFRVPGAREGACESLGEERPGIVHLVDAPGLDLDVGEAGGAQLRCVLSFLERARNAAHPELHAAPNVGRHVAADDDVG